MYESSVVRFSPAKVSHIDVCVSSEDHISANSQGGTVELELGAE